MLIFFVVEKNELGGYGDDIWTSHYDSAPYNLLKLRLAGLLQASRRAGLRFKKSSLTNKIFMTNILEFFWHLI